MEPEHVRLLEEGARAIGLRLDREQVSLLSRHVDLLLRWNKSINLTSITDPAEVVEKHVIDSLALAPLVTAGTLLDAGTGAGFPGLPLRIARPDLEVVLVDSVQKKVVNAAVSRAVAEPGAWLALAEKYVLPGGLAFCMLGPSDPVPDKQGDLVLRRELGYRLPFSRAQRRLAIFQRKA